MAYLETALYWGLPCLGLFFLLGGLGTLFGGKTKPAPIIPIAIMASEENLRAGDAGEAMVEEVLSNLKGIEHLPHFSFEVIDHTGYSVMCQVDHVVKGRDRLWIVETKNWAGTVSRMMSPKEDWIIRSPKGDVRTSYSPVEQARKQASRLSAATGVHVSFLVAMAGSATPSNGKWPFGVVHVSGLEQRIGGLARNRQNDGRGVSISDMDQGWRKAKELAALDADGSVSRLQAVWAATNNAQRSQLAYSATSSPQVTKKRDDAAAGAGGMLIIAMACGAAWWYLPNITRWASPLPPALPALSMPLVVDDIPIPPVPPIKPPPSRARH